ncbi:MAG: hypothetical protein HQL88_08590 [Magnetococcales bacterium]|nr:hypothetical protein [Magnetococcales bacterium]
MHETEQLAQLTASIQALTHTVAIHERRAQRNERLFRWIGAGLAALCVVEATTHLEWVERSFAGSQGTTETAQSQSAPEDSCKTLEGKIQAMGLNMPLIVQGLHDAALVMIRVKQDSDVLRANMLAAPKPPPSPEEQMAKAILVSGTYPPGIPQTSGKTDSPATPVKPPLSFAPLDQTLNVMEASPAMSIHRAREALKKMANDLSVMSYSMGSTMGRMGSWMPW